jgi:hypothetical protein
MSHAGTPASVPAWDRQSATYLDWAADLTEQERIDRGAYELAYGLGRGVEAARAWRS